MAKGMFNLSPFCCSVIYWSHLSFQIQILPMPEVEVHMGEQTHMQNVGSTSKTPDRLKILILAAEIVPFAKVGGLADVVGALPKALQELGHDVHLAMPRYGQIDPQRFHLHTVLDALTINIGNFQVPVSVCQATIGDAIPVYMI